MGLSDDDFVDFSGNIVIRCLKVVNGLEIVICRGHVFSQGLARFKVVKTKIVTFLTKVNIEQILDFIGIHLYL